MTDTKQIYEIGMLLIPSIAVDSIGEKVSKIKERLEKAGAVIISEDLPKLRQLAYTISKKADESKREVFDKGYFGWIKFELDSELLAEIDSFLRADKEIIRFLTVKTVREDTITPIPSKISVPEKEEEQPATTEEEVKEIEESIEELVIE